MNIDEMTAGPELDARIAVAVLGLPVVDLKDANCPYCGDEMRFCGERSWCSSCGEWRHSPYKEYSDDIAAAMTVFLKMAEMYCPQDPDASVTIIENIDGWLAGWTWHESVYTCGVGETIPLAICRFAYKAMEPVPA